MRLFYPTLPVAACLVAPLAAPVAAQSLTLPELAVLPRLIDNLCVDIPPSDGCEQVILLTGQEGNSTADLAILSDRRQLADRGIPLLVLRDAVYNGAAWGMSPSLEEAEDGGLLIHSEQSGIGRTPWFQTLHVAWQDHAFRVMEFSYSSYDRMTSGGYACTVNYAEGTGTGSVWWVDPETGEETEGYLLSAAAGAPPVPTTTQAFTPLPELCQTVQDQFFARLL